MPPLSAQSAALQNFEQLLESLREPGAAAQTLSPRRFCRAFRINLQTLAQQARVDPNTLKSAPQSESVQRFLRDVMRVIGAATNLSGDLNKALFWYRNYPLQPFRYLTAEHMVADGKVDAVVSYISILEAGPSG